MDTSVETSLNQLAALQEVDRQRREKTERVQALEAEIAECEGALERQRAGVEVWEECAGLKAPLDSRIDAAGFRECYWQGVKTRVEQRRAAGLPVPEGVNVDPGIDID